MYFILTTMGGNKKSYMDKEVEVSVILPCRNEEKTIGICIRKAQDIFKKYNINGEIIVSDSSRDNSPLIAESLGAIVVKHNKKGYGVALLEGFKEAKGKYIVMADADNTYDLLDVPRFLEQLEKGYDFVIGSRTKGKIKKGAMPFMHRYVGNPLLSFTLNSFFKSKISDANSGYRAFTREALDKMQLKTTGMEFASEMIVSALKNKLKIKEIPIVYSKRVGKSKISSFSDGWRHLRFMLLYSPTYLFLIPGIILFALGFLIMTLLLFGPITISGFHFDYHFMFLGSLLVLLGYQIISLGLYAKIYAINIGFEKHDKSIDFIAKYINLEKGIFLGLILAIFGLFIGFAILGYWIGFRFPSLNQTRTLLYALTLIIVGIQTVFSSFFLSLLLIEKK
jgi:glycosyltransferase involved in cell wall biosynthesis